MTTGRGDDGGSADLADLLPLSPLDFHTLLVLRREPLYGYGIMKAVAEESGGALAPEIGTLYRVLARLAGAGLVEETDAPADAEAKHPGRERRYYGLTPLGVRAARAEALRLSAAVDLARTRALLPGRGPG